MKRRAMSARSSRKVFNKGNKVHPRNAGYNPSVIVRGGIRM